MREEFETWIGERAWGIQKTNGFYDDPRTHDAWSAWQASRAAIEISLPERIPPEYKNDYWSGAKNGFNQGVETCRVVLSSAGLRVKQ